MKGIILAAGKGTRLRPWTDNVPKPLLKIAGRPILDYIMNGFAEAGVTDLVLITGYLAEQIEEHYGHSFQGMKLQYIEQKEQLGTGHALRLAEDFLKDGDFMLSFGDVMADHANYSALKKFHEEKGFVITITLNPVDDPYAGAAVYVDGDRVTALIEKPPRGTSTTNWNHRGIFMLNPIIFDELATLPLSARGEYELPVAVNNLIEKGTPVGAMAVSGLSSDIGTKEEFTSYEKYMLENR